jgi:hypothetical protein
MSDILNGHIQGDLTISPSFTDTGTLHTNLFEETTLNSGITIDNSDLKIKKSVKFKNTGGLTTDLTLNNSNEFSLTNNSGSVKILSLSTKGIEIASSSGDVLITSTTDSVDEFTGSLITNGGAVVKKTLNVKENINALDGVHTFTNTTGSQNVIEVKNTSLSGSSAVVYKDQADIVKLEVGYGNSLVGSPLNNISYIQSTNGSELALRGNSTDSIKISTNGSVDFYSTVASTNSTSGAIRVLGGISISNATDATSYTNGGSFTTAGGMSISKQLFLGNSYNLPGITSPSDPTTGMRFYVDTSDSKFKSRNNTGVVTVYQPTTTKGDLVTHNGTTAVRLPIGTDGYVLKANSSTSSGIEWAVGGSDSGGGGGNSSNKFTLRNINLRTSIIENTLGSYFMFIYPKVENGASRNFFASRSIISINGVSNSFNNNTSLTNSGSLTIDYNSYKGIYITKNNTEANGDYIGNTNEFFTYSEITLSGTSWTAVGIPDIVGAFSFSVSSKNGGPSATFITAKSTSSFADGNDTRLVSSPSSTSGVLEIRWLNTSQIEIRKTNVNDDGIYQLVDNFQFSVNTTESLVGSALTTINKQTFNYYENKSFMVSVSSLLANSPTAIFLCSKNSVTRVGNFTFFRSPGNTTGELLSMSWSSTNLLRFNKSGVGYDSQYTLRFTKLT